MAIRIQNAYGEQLPDTTDMPIDATWDDPETRNEQSHLETLRIKAELGVTKRQLLRELGYSQEQIEEMDADAVTERQQDTNIGAEIMRNFNAGEI